MMQMTIQVGPELFRFASKQQWVSKARALFKTSGVMLHETVCIDARGRICTSGREFMRAEREGAYPVVVYAIDSLEKCEEPEEKPA